MKYERKIKLGRLFSYFQTVEEITHLETTIVNLRDAKWEKNAPFCVAETRLGNRHQRPNIEMCRDEPSHRYVSYTNKKPDRD